MLFVCFCFSAQVQKITRQGPVMQAHSLSTPGSSVPMRSLCKLNPLCGGHIQQPLQHRQVSAGSRVQALDERQSEATAPRSPAPASADPFRSRLADPGYAFKSSFPPTGGSSYRPPSSSSSSPSPGYNSYPSSSATSSSTSNSSYTYVCA